MSKPSKKELLHVATLGKSVGLKGDMKLHIKSDFPEQFTKNATFYISPEQQVTIADVNHKRSTIRLTECNTPEEAKRFTNAKLYATIEQTRKNCKLEEGQYFWFDIEGCAVYEEGELLGEVTEIERILDQDYLKVKTARGLVEKGLPKTFLIPYQEHFVSDVDIDEKRITVSGGMDILEAS